MLDPRPPWPEPVGGESRHAGVDLIRLACVSQRAAPRPRPARFGLQQGAHGKNQIEGKAGSQGREPATAVGAVILASVRARMEGPMIVKSGAKEQLELYQRYSGMALEVTDFQIRAAYDSLARQALLRAAKLDPSAVANADVSAFLMAKLR